MTHGTDSMFPALYLCRYRLCSDMWELPIYCQQCVDGGKTHKHKNHFPADEAGVAAYLRDRINPGNEEMFAEMSEQSLDIKRKCQHEREDEVEHLYYAEMFDLQAH